MAFKIVVVGDVNGQFVDVFEKLAALHAKNAFCLALIAGNLFADPATATDADDQNLELLLNNKVVVPISTYFCLGKSPLPPKVVEKLQASGGELCDNVFFLGKRSTIKTSEGIKIAALGGSLDATLTSDSSKDAFTPFYSAGDAQALARGTTNVDILLTGEWPAKIATGSKVDLHSSGSEVQSSQQCLADICSAIKPRYFFSTSSVFFEREPFFHAQTEEASDGYAITRFISLAPFRNPQKQKWIYAFSIDISAVMPQVVPAGTTASPLLFTNKKRPALSEETNSGYSLYDRGYRSNKKRQRQPPPGPSECFFCLSNPNLVTHLVASIGEDAYLTIAKGPLTTSKTFTDLGVPAHMLVIPLPHSPTLSSIADVEARKNTIHEMERYRNALNTMLEQVAEGRLGSVTWEVSRLGGIHTHWQYLPVPAEKLYQGLVEAAFKVEAGNEKYPAFHVHNTPEEDATTSDYFKVWLWRPVAEDPKETNNGTENAQEPGSAGRTSVMELPLDESFRFDLQFGRRVLAKLLGLEDRLNWRDCSQSEQAETADVEAFKKLFRAFDFTLNE